MARSRFALVWPALVALTVAFSADADGKKCRLQDKDKTSLKFQITGPMGLKIDGTSKDLAVNDDGSKITLTASVQNLKTGIGFRDNHLKEHIEAGKYKDMTLVVDRGAVKIPGSGKVTGKLSWRGKTVDKPVSYKIEKKGDALDVSGNFEVNLDEHGSGKACKAAVCTGNIVKVEANFKVVES